MKITAQVYCRMKEAMSVVLERYGSATIRENNKELTQQRMLWDMWHCANTDIRKADPNFDIYDGGVEDSHIETALRKIADELGLLDG